MPRRATRAEFNDLVARARRVMRRLLGPKVEVSIDLETPRRLKEYLGYASKLGPHKYEIKLSNDLTRDQLLDLIVHEMAHVLHWESGNRGYKWPHGSQWGVAWASCYRAMFGVR